MAEQDAGWNWFDAVSAPGDAAADRELCRAYARCFAGEDGRQVMAHLTRSILERRLPPSASDSELRHLEGQRCAIAAIVAMVGRGRS